MRRNLALLCALLFCIFCAHAETVEPTCYTFHFADQNGEPVSGVMLNICSDSFCAVAVSDETGTALYDGEPFAYDLHILRMPDGYTFNTEEPLQTEAAYGSMDFILTRQ